jgi:Metal-dependent hydrolases of the beta-lactamase superfamily I
VGQAKNTVVSDLGFVSDELVAEARGSDILAFEANHDVDMLRTGKYPEYLQKRILGNRGHLSNEQSAEAISRISESNTRIILTHLSQENNTPDVAYGTVRSYLENRAVKFTSLECAYQESGSTLHTLDDD